MWVIHIDIHNFTYIDPCQSYTHLELFKLEV
jgi:hypothetical protein